MLIPLYYYGFYWQARQSTHKAVRAPGTGSLGCFKALQWAGCFRSFAQRHQLRRVSEQREEDPQLDELCIRNLDLEEVDSPLLYLQAAAGRVRASGIAVGASRRDASAGSRWVRASGTHRATCVSTSTTTNRSNGVSFALTSSVIPRYARLGAAFTSSATCWFCIAAADAACTPTASSTGVRSWSLLISSVRAASRSGSILSQSCCSKIVRSASIVIPSRQARDRRLPATGG